MARPAYYAARPGGWRDWWTLLHPPYTSWHLSYVVIGATLAPRTDGVYAQADATIESAGTPLPEPYVVKEGELFVLGDNRTSSNDSRSWNGGQGAGVPFGTVEGRAERFFLATRRDGRVDFADFMGPLDRRLTAEGIDTRSLEQGIARCLSEWPSETEPPPKAVASNGAGHDL